MGLAEDMERYERLDSGMILILAVGAVVNLARHLDIDPENALTSANSKFERRFRSMEADIAAEGLDFRKMTLESLDQHWRKAKRRVG